MRIKIIICVLLLLPLCVRASEKPLWEIGLGAAGIYNPHYLGADQNDAYLLPLPYIIYRGEVIRADRDGLRGFIYNSETLNLRLSVSGSLPVNSEDNDARAGMDDLDLMLEAGPTLEYTLYHVDEHLVRADFPVRGAFLVGGEFMYHQGWTSNPRLHHETDVQQWTITTTLGPLFSDRRYHGYIYDVGQSDVTADRSFYQSDSGYTGSRFSIGAKRRFGRYHFGITMRYYNLDGAANADSPLLKQDDYLSFSFVAAYIFKESSAQVAIEHD